MRAKQFISEEDLYEIKMSPKNLESLASGIDARVGMEFEMVIPDIKTSSNRYDFEPEEDYYYDEPVKSIDNVVGFFDDGEHNSRRNIRRLKESLEEAYNEWAIEKQNKEWEDEKEEVFNEYVQNYRGIDPDDEEFEDYVYELMRERSPESQKVRQRWEEEHDLSDYDEEEFLNDQGIRQLSDVSNNYDFITWPHWTEFEDENEDEDTINDSDREWIAEKLQPIVQMRVVIKSSMQNYETDYLITSDSSINTEGDSTAAKLEIVSPYMSPDKMFDQYNRILKFANKYNCSTNESTGLHINVSVKTNGPLDYTKLILLLGEKYLGELYKRVDIRYARFVVEKIKELTSEKELDRSLIILDKLRKNLFDAAAKEISELSISSFTDKYLSAHIKNRGSDNWWIEFRTPGGDWLNIPVEQIRNTVNRYIVVLDAACDPTKYKEEYMKKLYTLLSAIAPKDEDIVGLIAGYMTRSDSKEELKAKLKQRALTREVPKTDYRNIIFRWAITPSTTNVATKLVKEKTSIWPVYVMAKNKLNAIEQGSKLLADIYPTLGILPADQYVAEVLSVAYDDSAPGPKYEFRVSRPGYATTATVIARTREEAYDIASRSMPGLIEPGALSRVKIEPIRRAE